MPDFSTFPALGNKRRLYVRGISKSEEAELVAKGYDPVDVLTLPMDTSSQRQSAVMAWLQGMGEGSIDLDPERRKTLELEARAEGMLVNRNLRLEGKVELSQETLESLINFAPNRHTVKESTGLEKIIL